MKNKCSLLKRNFEFRKFDGQSMLVAEWKERRKSYIETLVTPRDPNAFDKEGEYLFITPKESESPIKSYSFCKIYGVDILRVKKIPMLKREIKVIELFSPAGAASQEELFLVIIDKLRESPAEAIVLFELSQKNNFCFFQINNRKRRIGLFRLLKRRCRSEFAIENNNESKAITVSVPKEEERYYNFYNIIIDIAIAVLNKPKRRKPFIFLGIANVGIQNFEPLHHLP